MEVSPLNVVLLVAVGVLAGVVVRMALKYETARRRLRRTKARLNYSTGKASSEVRQWRGLAIRRGYQVQNLKRRLGMNAEPPPIEVETRDLIVDDDEDGDEWSDSDARTVNLSE